MLGAPLVENLGTGCCVFGTVRRAGDGESLVGVRIRIGAATGRGGERGPSSHGSVSSAVNGNLELKMAQIVPNFRQLHAHLAYHYDDFETVFLRPVMSSAEDTSVQAHFELAS